MSETLERLDPDHYRRFPDSIGGARSLPTWSEIADYFAELAAGSDHLIWRSLGEDTFGESIGAAFVSSPANLAAIEETTAGPNGRPLVVAITAGIHPDEIAGTISMPSVARRLLGEAPECTPDLLEHLMVILIPAVVPGGYERVRHWCLSVSESPYDGAAPPGLIHPVGHDLNRDWLGLTQPETRVLARELFQRWKPALHLDLHSMQPNGARYILPPPIDPVDPLVDPELLAEVHACSGEMLAEMTRAGLCGVASGVLFDGWSPARSFVQFTGGARVLAEVASARMANPVELPEGTLARYRDINPAEPSARIPRPWTGGSWSLADAVRYHVAAAEAFIGHVATRQQRIADTVRSASIRWTSSPDQSTYVLFPLETQHDPGAAWRLVETLQAGGVEVKEAARPFVADDVLCPAGSLIVYEAQDFGRFARATLAPLPYPMADPRLSVSVPYDATAHTSGLLLGVDVARVSGTLAIETRTPRPPAPLDVASGHLPCNDSRSFAAVATWLRDGRPLFRARNDQPKEHVRAGDFLTPERSRSWPDASLIALRQAVIGLYGTAVPDQPDSGWIGLTLAAYGWTPEPLDDRLVRSGSLQRFDTIVIPELTPEQILSGNNLADYPAEYCGGLGHQGISALMRWAEGGGTLVVIGGGCELFTSDHRVPVRVSSTGRTSGRAWIPGAILRFEVDRQHPLAYGCDSVLAAMVTDGPSFEVRSGVARLSGPVRYPLDNPLLSGWMAGAELLRGKAAVVDVPFGRGRLVLMGLRPGYRGVGLAAGRLLANAVLMSASERRR